MRLIVVRHAETIENKHRIVQGQRGGTLSTRGEKQAQHVARALEKEDLDIAYVSDLTRARDTAQAILARHPRTPVTYTEALRERDEGIFTGKHLFQKVLFYALYPAHFSHITPRGAESYRQLQKRMRAFYNQLLPDHAEDTVLLVSHGAAIATLLLSLFDLPFTYPFYRALHPSNASISILQIEDGGIRHIERLNAAAQK